MESRLEETAREAHATRDDLQPDWKREAVYIFHFSFYHPARMATNLEYCGISVSIENSGNSVRPQGKIVAKKVVLGSSFK